MLNSEETPPFRFWNNTGCRSKREDDHGSTASSRTLEGGSREDVYGAGRMRLTNSGAFRSTWPSAVLLMAGAKKSGGVCFAVLLSKGGVKVQMEIRRVLLGSCSGGRIESICGEVGDDHRQPAFLLN